AQMYNLPNGSGISPNFGDAAVGTTPYFYPIDYTTDGHSWQDKQYGAQVNHSKGHHQQYFDLTKAGMWKNDKELVTCIDCHDAHGTSIEHQLVQKPDNNALCLDCHNGDEQTIGGFGSITRAMVDELQTSGTVDPVIATAVEGHMKDKAGMTASYDPVTTGVGRCTLCHMAQTAKSARWTPTGSRGYREGDIHSHAFDIMSPTATQKMFQAVGSKTSVTPSGWTNSCGVCHPNNTL
ncbi:MAG: cytochrome c3 family protein, partial [Deltaproteobacteria bacterium]|nr:cytochrome c3 family protein [Deltaproteobacteria bacterium]